MRWLAVLLMTFIVAPAFACLWDDDTLAIEAQGLPSVLNAIVGRIEVNPPEYYQRRIELSTKRVKVNPLDFEAYDNLAVAHDKLGDFDASIEILETKRKELTKSKTKPTTDPMKDPWYRYHANLGTVYAHEWIRQFPNQDQKHLDLAIDHLNKSIEINPDAHFGREVVQVKILELFNRRFGSAKREENHDPEGEWRVFVETRGSDSVIEGVIGMMALGAGADSPDLIALIRASIPEEAGHLSYLCDYRIGELKEMGKEPKLELEPALYGIPRKEYALKTQYKLLRENAVKFRENRTTHIQTQLLAGRHPDSHLDFWAGYKEIPEADYKRLNPPNSKGFTSAKYVIDWGITPILLAIIGVIVASFAVIKIVSRTDR